jgi:hypothetical protein
MPSYSQNEIQEGLLSATQDFIQDEIYRDPLEQIRYLLLNDIHFPKTLIRGYKAFFGQFTQPTLFTPYADYDSLPVWPAGPLLLESEYGRSLANELQLVVPRRTLKMTMEKNLFEYQITPHEVGAFIAFMSMYASEYIRLSDEDIANYQLEFLKLASQVTNETDLPDDVIKSGTTKLIYKHFCESGYFGLYRFLNANEASLLMFPALYQRFYNDVHAENETMVREKISQYCLINSPFTFF